MKKRIVVKVGTSTLTHVSGGMNFRNLDRLARVLTDVKNAGNDVLPIEIVLGSGKNQHSAFVNFTIFASLAELPVVGQRKKIVPFPAIKRLCRFRIELSVRARRMSM